MFLAPNGVTSVIGVAPPSVENTRMPLSGLTQLV
jgi:hypothetical protein